MPASTLVPDWFQLFEVVSTETPEIRGDEGTTSASSSSPPVCLLSMPDDVLGVIFRAIVQVGDGSPHTASVNAPGFARGLSLATTCRAMIRQFYTSIDSLMLPSVSSLSDWSVDAIARNLGVSTRQVVLRNCDLLTSAAALSLSFHMKHLSYIDLSFLPNLTDDGVLAILHALGPNLRQLLLRQCTLLTDRSVEVISVCHQLELLDISRIGTSISDSSISVICQSIGEYVRLLAISENPKLGNLSFEAVGMHCRRLEQFCARKLPLVTDAGLTALCRGIGQTIRGLDILDCPLLTKGCVIRSFQNYCHHIELPDPDFYSLRYVILRPRPTSQSSAIWCR